MTIDTTKASIEVEALTVQNPPRHQGITRRSASHDTPAGYVLPRGRIARPKLPATISRAEVLALVCANSDARKARARRQAAKRWAAKCHEYRLVCAADEGVLEAWLSPLDMGFDWSGFDFGDEFEMPSQRVWNRASEAEQIMHVDDDRDERVILFVLVDDVTGVLFDAEHLAAHPGVRITPAHPDMPLHSLIDYEQDIRIKGLSRALDEVGVGFANVVGLPAGCFWGFA